MVLAVAVANRAVGHSSGEPARGTLDDLDHMHYTFGAHLVRDQSDTRQSGDEETVGER
jgi:hypothetical protein